MLYGWLRMIYLLRKCDMMSIPSYAQRISPAKRISFAEQISPAPSGTDIIAKSSFAEAKELFAGDPYRIRTDVKGVRGLCLNHLTNGPVMEKKESREQG